MINDSKKEGNPLSNMIGAMNLVIFIYIIRNKIKLQYIQKIKMMNMLIYYKQILILQFQHIKMLESIMKIKRRIKIKKLKLKKLLNKH